MNELERWLKARRMRSPSPELDARVDRLLADGATKLTPWYSRPITLWQCAVLCVLLAAGGFYLGTSRPVHAPTPADTYTVMYVIRPDAATWVETLDGKPTKQWSLAEPLEAEVVLGPIPASDDSPFDDQI